MLDYVTWLKKPGMMGLMVAKDPVHMMKAFWEYRWMGSFPGSFAFVDRLFGASGREPEVASSTLNTIVRTLCGLIGTIVGNDRRLGGGPLMDQLVGLDETILTLFAGFPTLYPEPMLPEFVICDVDQHIEPYYIDVASPTWPARRRIATLLRRDRRHHRRRVPDIRQAGHLHQPAPATPANPLQCSSAAASIAMGLGDYPFAFAMQHNEEGGQRLFRSGAAAQLHSREIEKSRRQVRLGRLLQAAVRINEQSTPEMEKGEILAPPYSPCAASPRRFINWLNGPSPTAAWITSTAPTARSSRSCVRPSRTSTSPSRQDLPPLAFLGGGPSAVLHRPSHWTQNCGA